MSDSGSPSFAAAAIQDTERRRCVSCERWGGVRRAGAAAGTVEYDAQNDKGPCCEGPWHGSLRGARNACGQWILWKALNPGQG